jgi:hypothetical protein
MVWDPKRITPKGWADVVAFYRHIEDRNDDFRPLRALAEHVAKQAYAASLSAAVSGTALLVTRRAGADWAQDSLRIDVGLSGSIRLVVQRRGAAKPTIVETESQTVPALVAAFEGILAKTDWG